MDSKSMFTHGIWQQNIGGIVRTEPIVLPSNCGTSASSGKCNNLKLSEYIEILQKSLVENGDLHVIYSEDDDEGNTCHNVNGDWAGSVAYVEDIGEYNLQMIDDDRLSDYEEYEKVIIIN